MKKIKIIIMIILGLCLLNNNVLAETIIDVNIEPDEPEPASQITITADISSEKDIDKVYIEIQECKEDLCFLKENITMTKINSNYQKKYQLQKDEATYFKYSIAILFTDGSWYNQTENTEVTLKPDSSNGGTNGGDGEDKNNPGFEFILLITAISFIIFLIRRKRFR